MNLENMSSLLFEQTAHSTLADWRKDIPDIPGVDFSLEDNSVGFMPDYVPETRPASLLSEETANEFDTLLLDSNMGASQEHGSGLQTMYDPNDGANPDIDSGNESSLAADSSVHPPATHSEFQDLFSTDPAQSTMANFDAFTVAAAQENTPPLPADSPTAPPASGPAAAPSTGFMATEFQEIEHDFQNGFPAQQLSPIPGATQFTGSPFQQQALGPADAHSAGTTAIGVQEIMPRLPAGGLQQPVPFDYAGANMLDLHWHDPAARLPAAANIGPMPAASQEIQLGQPQAEVLTYGVSHYPPYALGQDHGKYVPGTTRGPQRNPARRVRINQEPGQARSNQQPERPRDNQEPPVRRAKNRQGAIPGYSPRLRLHRNRCYDPAAGCDQSCELREKHPNQYEELRTKRSKKHLRHLHPQYRNQLWQHIPKPSGDVSQ